MLAKGAALMVKRIPVSAERQGELREDLRKNVPRHMRHALDEYVRWLHRNERPAARLCQGSRPALTPSPLPMTFQNMRVLVQEHPIELVERVTRLVRVPPLRHRRNLLPMPLSAQPF
jgi:hypothetical protein